MKTSRIYVYVATSVKLLAINPRIAEGYKLIKQAHFKNKTSELVFTK